MLINELEILNIQTIFMIFEQLAVNLSRLEFHFQTDHSKDYFFTGSFAQVQNQETEYRRGQREALTDSEEN